MLTRQSVQEPEQKTPSTDAVYSLENIKILRGIATDTHNLCAQLIKLLLVLSELRCLDSAA